MELSAQARQSLEIPFYSNLKCDKLGHDSFEHCFDKSLFTRFGKITYQFNDLGYRTKPVDDFVGDEILVIGDSFTLGLGVNALDRYSEQAEDILGHSVLNFSLNGASNDWIARKTNALLQIFHPRYIIIHWTFSHRREKNQPEWKDNERTECEPLYSDQDNLQNWIENFNKIKFPNVLHSAIPNWHPDFDYSIYPISPPIQRQDLSRDGFHYGPKTHRALSEKITNFLAAHEPHPW